ncbi:2Fe-2S iron-sulfur cluster-binding protein [Streptomyces sp. NPDC060223]|uniref:2Fe-2S iron-sulfur cluster-binding protein n=1 Tax=unclassified Streptomyces TaxID=2593676 RepID=UPI0036288B71
MVTPVASAPAEPPAAPLPGRRERRAFHPLSVTGIDRSCPGAVVISFEVPDRLAGLFTFRAGQALTLRHTVNGQEERRSYSICTPEGTPLRIGVRKVEGGLVSGWLVDELQPGDRIEVQPPSGGFTADLTRPATHVMVAAGSGITPMLSLAATALRQPHSSVTLFYGNRSSGSAMFTDELADVKDRHGTRFSLTHLLSREGRPAELLSGRMDERRLRELLAIQTEPAAVDHWWLCGPQQLVRRVRTFLIEDLAISANRIHQELFYADADAANPPSAAPPRAGTSPVSAATVILDGRRTDVSVPRGATILDAAQGALPDLPFSCRGGVCGTCRARVVEGEARMRRNFALEESETESGFVLTCQAEPVGRHIVVDFDA